MCLNLASREFSQLNREGIIDLCLRIKPIFVVIDSSMNNDQSEYVCRGQHQSMRCFIRIQGESIETNPTHVISQLLTDSIIPDGGINSRGCAEYAMQAGAGVDKAADSMMKSMEQQIHYDGLQLFLCDVQTTCRSSGARRSRRS